MSYNEIFNRLVQEQSIAYQRNILIFIISATLAISITGLIFYFKYRKESGDEK